MPRLGVTEQTVQLRERVDDVARSLLAEVPLPAPSGRRVLVALMGLPASGKSHLARLLAASLAAPVVSSDALRRRLFVAASYTRAETRTVFAVAHAMTRALLADRHTVVFDATNLRERDRRPLARLADDAGATFLLVRAIAPDGEVRARLALRRERTAPEDASDADVVVYETMRARVEEPATPYVTVDTSADLDAAIAMVVDAVRAPPAS